MEDLRSYWNGRKEFLECCMCWDEEDLSNLDAIEEMYQVIEEVNRKWCPDVIRIENSDDESVCQIWETIQQVLELTFQVNMKIGPYRTVLKWHNDNPEGQDECFDFFFPDGVKQYKERQ